MNRTCENIREYSFGDEGKIVDLHREVFHSDLDIARWKWQFVEGHPEGKSWINIAESGTEVVGNYCVMRQHLNFKGHQLTAGQSCDTMVRSDQRGKKLFLKLAVTNYEHARNDGAKAVIGFPNRNSYPGLMKLGWVRLFYLDYYYLLLGCKRIVGYQLDVLVRNLIKAKLTLKLKAKLLRRAVDYSISTTNKLPDELGEMLLEINKYEVWSIWKDVEYLKWRYETHPSYDYKFHFIKVVDKYESIIITKTENQESHICEVLSRSKNQILTLILLYHVILEAIRNKAQRIDFHGNDNGFFSCLFEDAGFKKRKSNFILCGKTFIEDSELSCSFMLPHNWTISVGDIDVF